MPGHDIITIGASAGGVEALAKLVSGLPGDLPAALFVVLHIPANTTSMLPAILQRAGPLPVSHPIDGAKIECGHIYVASPDHHLLVEHGNIRLIWGPTENRHRPAIDPLMRSAAIAYGPRVIGVLLSGMDGDGTAGLRAIKRRGGLAVVQDPAEALFPSMPENALAYARIDHTVTSRELGPLLGRLARCPADDDARYPVPDELILEQKQMTERPGKTDLDGYGTLSAFTCP
jgi:two-component system chemotaxis response regulator CheB